MTVKAFPTKRDRLEEKETAIVSAATTVFLRHGYKGAKMTEIARLADVAEGTLYLYFKNKNALMLAVVEDHWRRITQGAVEPIRDVDDCFGQIEAHARYHLTTLILDWRLIDLSYALYYAYRAPGAEATDYKRDYAAVFDGIFRRGVDRGDLRKDVSVRLARDLFYGTLEYSARTIGKRIGKKEIESAVQDLLRIFRSGLVAPTAKVAKGPNKGGAAGNDLEAVTQRLEKAATKIENAAADEWI